MFYFNKLSNLNKLVLFTLASLLIFAFYPIPVSAFRYGGGGSSFTNLTIRIIDPYTCGGNNIGGIVIGGYNRRIVTVTFTPIGSNNPTYTFTANVDNNGNWSIPISYDLNSSNYIVSGQYVITSKVVDEIGNSDTYTYTAHIRPPSECTQQENKPKEDKDKILTTTSTTKDQKDQNNKDEAGKVLSLRVADVQPVLIRTGALVKDNPLSMSMLSSGLVFLLYLSFKDINLLKRKLER